MDKIPDPKMRTKKFIFCHCKFQGGNPPSPPVAIGDHNKKTTNVFFLCTAAATVVKNLRVCLLMMMMFLQNVSVVGVQKIKLWSLNTILQWWRTSSRLEETPMVFLFFPTCASV